MKKNRQSVLSPIFGRFDINIAKIVPKKVIEILRGLAKTIGIEVFGSGFNNLFELGKDFLVCRNG
jgi:hypothetical protein